MLPVTRSSALSDQERNRLESLLLEFDEAWDGSSLDDFDTLIGNNGAEAFRRVAIGELVKIDLQRSWLSDQPRELGFYLDRFPELGDVLTVDAELVAAEYLARRQVENDVKWDVYAERYPTQTAKAEGYVQQFQDSQSMRRTATGKAQASIDTSRISAVGDRKTKSDATALDLPVNFGRYRIIKELGSGAMGKVYLAHDEQLDRQVALKTPFFSGSDSENTVTRFYREARAAAKLQHRNICPIYDVGEIEGRHFISMAFVKGRCMSEFIRPDRLPPTRTSALLIQRLALALAEAHQHNVIHRDLKPANIMIDLKKEPIVMDFGLARLTDMESRVTRSGTAVGTPAYMSPEQIRGESDSVDAAADIYALGVILYELLTGKLPFSGPIAQVVYQIVHDQPKSPSELRSDVDPELESIFQRMVAKDKSERFQSMDEVAKVIKSYLTTSKRAAHGRQSGSKSRVTESNQQSQTDALSALFQSNVAGDPTRTAVEPIPSIVVSESQPRTAIKTESRPKKKRPARTYLIGTGLIGILIVFGVIISLSDGTKIEVPDGTNATINIGENGKLESISVDSTTAEQSQASNSQNGNSAAVAALDMPMRDSSSKVAAVAGPAQGEMRPGEKITIPTISGVASMAVSPDGRYLVGSMIGKPPVFQVWDTTTGERIQRIASSNQDDPTPSQLQFTPDGKHLLYSKGRTVCRMTFGEKDESPQQEFPAGPGLVVFPKSELALALFHVQSAHRKKLGEIPQRIRVWNWRSNEVLFDEVFPIQKQSSLWAPSVSPDERFLTLAWGNNYVYRYDLDVDNGQFKLGRRFSMEKFSRIRGELNYSPDSKLAATSVKSGACMGVFYDVDSGKIIHRFDPTTAKETNSGQVYGTRFAFTNDGKHIVSTDHNGRVALWEFPSGELIREIGEFQAAGNHTPPKVKVTVDNRVIVAGDSADSRITIQQLVDAQKP